MKTMCMAIKSRGRQAGVVLLVALIFLIVLTLLGLSVIDGSVMETRLSGNYQERNHAFQTAEAGLLEIRDFLGNEDAIGDVIDASSDPAQDYSLSRPDLVIHNRSTTNATRITYKGKGFTLPDGAVGSDSSMIKMCASYFEIETVGNSYIGTASGNDALKKKNISVTLKRGMRRASPCDSSLTESSSASSIPSGL